MTTNGQSLKAAGMASAAERRHKLLNAARVLAVRIARRRSTRECDADLVRHVMVRFKLPYHELGNAAGSIFIERQWEFTGKLRTTTHPASHARDVKVWRLKDGT